MEIATTTKNREAKSLGVPVTYIIMADLIKAGYSENDAYTIAYPENAVLSAVQNRSVRENILSSPKFRKVLDGKGVIQEDEVQAGELMDKKKTAMLIMKAALEQPSNSKERIEGLMKYSDLMGYKKDEVEEDSADAITFFLPMKCSHCPIFTELNMRRADDGEPAIRADEIGRPVQG